MEQVSAITALSITLLLAIAAIFLREFIAIWRDRTKEVVDVRIVIAKLEGRIEALEGAASNIPKLMKDIDAAHNRIREIQGKEPIAR
jgi:hypothetical protein